MADRLDAWPEIRTLLEQTVAELQRFVAAIAAERRILVAGDIERLPGIVEEKSAAAARLASLENKRGAALGAAGCGNRQEDIEAWLTTAPGIDSSALRKLWASCMDLAAEAKRDNEINGKLIGAHLQQTQQALATVLGEATEATTYGADGQRNTPAGRRPLGSA